MIIHKSFVRLNYLHRILNINCNKEYSLKMDRLLFENEKNYSLKKTHFTYISVKLFYPVTKLYIISVYVCIVVDLFSL